MAIYRALLRLYPKSFRAEYGAEMLKDFNRQWRDLSRGARVGLLFGAAAGLALIMTLAGSLLPAWRAMRIDPIAATRTE
jgi:hypothetical protein